MPWLPEFESLVARTPGRVDDPIWGRVDGGVDLPPQAGVAVYERGPSERLAHARIHDDVEGPVE